MDEGKIVAVRGVVVDIEFSEDKTPHVYDALVLETKELWKVTMEVEAILDQGLVRTVVMGNVY